MERDSEDDDDAMLDGVAEWAYYKNDKEEGGRLSSPSESEADSERETAEQMHVDEKATSPIEEEPETREKEDDHVDDNDADEGGPKDDSPPSSPRVNGRRGRAAAAPKAKAKPKPRAPPAKPAPVVKAKTAVSLLTKSPATPVRGRIGRRVVRKVKDVYAVEGDN